jgi:hypothetical protein
MKIRSGVPEWHSYDTGQSLIFSFLPLPRFLAQGVIEPLLCGALGWWLVQRSSATVYIGWWIIISAGLLFILENTIRVARRESLFDLGDTVVESEHFARRADNFTAPSSGSGPAQRRRRSGIVHSLLRAVQLAPPADGRRKNQGTDDQQR